jgi:hypothetical protein
MIDDTRALLKPFAILGALLALGMILGGMLLGMKVRDFKRADRYVEVKGLVERTVKSDNATWPISFSETGDSLPTVFAASQKDKAAVLAFLTAQGFSAQDVTVGSIAVTDKTANQYGANNGGPRFIVQQTVTVQSNDVDKVAKANANTADLIGAGVVISSENGQGSVTYKFNGLNALKGDMITEATKNARASADRFAADSGSKVGEIRSANQGVFSISAVNGGSATGEDGAADTTGDASIMKKVRVVSTIDYYLQD